MLFGCLSLMQNQLCVVKLARKLALGACHCDAIAMPQIERTLHVCMCVILKGSV